MKKIYTTFLTALTFLAVSAQDLSTEITVDRTIIPVQNEATPLKSVVPTFISPSLSENIPDFAYLSSPADFDAYTSLISIPTTLGNSIKRSKGYASLGYFPTYKLAASVGYRLIDTKSTNLSIASSFNGYLYHNPTKELVRKNAFNIGADFYHGFSKGWSAAASVAYNLTGLANPTNAYMHGQRYSTIKADIATAKHTSSVDFDANIFVNSLGLSKSIYDSQPKYRATLTGIKAYFAPTNNDNTLGYSIEALGDVYINNAPKFDALGNAVNADMIYSIASVKPGIDITLGNARMHIGINAQLSMENSQSTTSEDNIKFKIAPDIHTSVGSDRISAYASFTGGAAINTFERMVNYSSFAILPFSMPNAFTPIDIKIGVNLVAFEGFSCGGYAGYLKTNDIAMFSSNGSKIFYSPDDIKGFYLGANVDYSFREILSAHADISSKALNALDHAKLNLNANIDIRPFDKFTATIEYKLRSGRYYKSTNGDVDLGTLSHLNLRAAYNITSKLTAFTSIENILGNRCWIIPSTKSEPIMPLVGVMYTL